MPISSAYDHPPVRHSSFEAGVSLGNAFRMRFPEANSTAMRRNGSGTLYYGGFSKLLEESMSSSPYFGAKKETLAEGGCNNSTSIGEKSRSEE